MSHLWKPSDREIELSRLRHRMPGYGDGAHWMAQEIIAMLPMVGARTILDYGCGKGSLVKALQRHSISVTGYDPAIDEYSQEPYPADIVVVTDVLDIIEPDRRTAVLDKIFDLANVCLVTATPVISIYGRPIPPLEYWGGEFSKRGIMFDVHLEEYRLHAVIVPHGK